jgi:peptide/nickel transport system substrate-binding protein
MLSKRTFGALSFIVVVTLLVTACGGDSRKDTATSSSSGTAAAGAAGQPTQASGNAITRQNTLIVATPEDVISLDPPVGGNDLSSEIAWQMYEMPVNYVFAKKDNVLVQQGDKTEPWMAEKVDVSPDGLTLTFTMRKGVKFHPSGNEMSAKDLDWIIRRELEMNVGFGKFIMSTAQISKPGRIVDQYTYEVTLDRPNVAALAILALIDTPLIDSEEAKKHATAEDPWAHQFLNRNTLGTGPYYLVSFRQGQEVVLEQVPNYWRKAPYFKRIVYRTVPDPAARLTLLRSGEVDIAYKLPGQELKALEGVRGLAVREAFEPRVQMMFMNTQMGPTTDLNVRKAIAAAVPYKDILSAAFYGSGRPHDGFFMPDSLGYVKAPPDLFAQDMNKARSYLAQSGYPNGFKVDLAIDSVVPQHETAALLIQQALKPLNIEVNILKLPTAQFRADGNAKKYPLIIHQALNWINEGTYVITSRLLPTSASNWSAWQSQEVAMLLPTLFTTSEATRKAGYERVQRLWHEAVPAAVFGQIDQRVAMASNIQDYVFSYVTYPQYYYVSRS